MRQVKSPLYIPPRSASGPPGYGETLSVEMSKSAVVVVDMQRFFVDATPFEAMRQVVPAIARVLSAARRAGMTVVHVITEFRADMADAGRPGSRTRQMMESAGEGLTHGGSGVEIAPLLSAEPSDLIVVKKCFSGFVATDLHHVLAHRGIETVLFAGGTTTVCVESTLRDGMFLGYNGVLLSDCTADMSPTLHDSALERVDSFFGWVCSSRDVIRWLEGVTGAASSSAFSQ